MRELLIAKIKALNETMWEHRASWPVVERWLNRFAPDPQAGHSERLHALFLLSHFSFYSSKVVRALLQALYRDLFQYPLLAAIRRRNQNTLNTTLVSQRYTKLLASTRFLGMGNPSESGTHLLYYFRQENQLSKDLFVQSHELFDGTAAQPRLAKNVDHVVLLDDFCGSGTQAVRYSKGLLTRLRALRKRLRISYLPLFATTEGLNKVRRETTFSRVDTVCELDPSFRCLSTGSRLFREAQPDINRAFAEQMCRAHGAHLLPNAPLGFGGCELLLGFAHNVPNNTLPVFWSMGAEDGSYPWDAVFPRHLKGPGW
jgi:hypothetical protein